MEHDGFETIIPNEKYDPTSEAVRIGKETERTVARMLTEELSYNIEDISDELYKGWHSPFDIYATRADRTLLVDVKRQSAQNGALYIQSRVVDKQNEYNTRAADFKLIIFQVKDKFYLMPVELFPRQGYLVSNMYIVEHHHTFYLSKSMRSLDKNLDKIRELLNV